ncbi:cation:proton antiporter, partial [Candidatus Riflebacteria bacterium]
MQEIINFIFNTLENNIIFSIGFLLFAGHIFAKILLLVKLPDITGYILAGLLLGPYASGVIHKQTGVSLQVVTQTALALIALSIGFQFPIAKLKKFGMKILLITTVEVFSAFILVSAGLYFCGMKLPFALLLGAISSATAPGATVTIVQHMKVKGVFVDFLFGVVGMDDAVCIMLYGIVSAFAISTLGTAAVNSSGIGLIVAAFNKVFLSAIVGVFCALFLYLFTYGETDEDELLVIALAVIFITISFSMSLHLSALITNMVAGFVFINISSKGKVISELLLHFEAPIITLFFVIAGTKLDLHVFLQDKKYR